MKHQNNLGKKWYNVNVKFIDFGGITIDADSKEEAKKRALDFFMSNPTIGHDNVKITSVKEDKELND